MYSQQNIEAFYALIGSLPGNQWKQLENFDFIRTANSIWPNQLLNLKVGDYSTAQLLDKLEEQVKSGQIPHILMCAPHGTSAYLMEALTQRPYKTSTWSAMSHQLKTIDQAYSSTTFSIERLKNKQELKQWLTLVETELMVNHPLDHNTFEALLKHPDCYFFLGHHQNKAVTTALLFCTEDTAGIYLVATAASSRKQGFGKQMTLHCLSQAKALRCKQVDIQATDMGKTVYQSLGFEDHGAIQVFRIGENTILKVT